MIAACSSPIVPKTAPFVIPELKTTIESAFEVRIWPPIRVLNVTRTVPGLS